VDLIEQMERGGLRPAQENLKEFWNLN
jgi:hypothetical protein